QSPKITNSPSAISNSLISFSIHLIILSFQSQSVPSHPMYTTPRKTNCLSFNLTLAHKCSQHSLHTSSSIPSLYISPIPPPFLSPFFLFTPSHIHPPLMGGFSISLSPDSTTQHTSIFSLIMLSINSSHFPIPPP